MASTEPVWLVVCSFPDERSAASICRSLVEEQLAACATLVPAARSFYRWQNSVQDASELLAWIKTTPHRYPALEARLSQLHPYDTPEIIAFPSCSALPDYAAWVHASCPG